MKNPENVITLFDDYMVAAFDPNPRRIISRAKASMSDWEFDTFVGTGVSGALMVPLLARAMKKHFLIVRKRGDGSHSAHSAVGRLGRRWVFVDDFISTGETQQRVRQTVGGISLIHNFETVEVGSYFYDWDSAELS